LKIAAGDPCEAIIIKEKGVPRAVNRYAEPSQISTVLPGKFAGRRFVFIRGAAN
jgi:hypothetical protein